MNLDLLQRAVELRGSAFVELSINELLGKLVKDSAQDQTISADAEAIHELLCANADVLCNGVQVKYDVEKRCARGYIPTVNLARYKSANFPPPYCALSWSEYAAEERSPDMSVAVMRGEVTVSRTQRATQEQIDQLRHIIDEYSFGLQAAVNFHLRTYGKPCVFTYVHAEDGVEFVL